MRLLRWHRLRTAALIAATMVLAAPAAAEPTVDLELVLTVDVSLSMDFDEQRLQRDGYVEAFRDPQVRSAIQSGARGRISVTYIEWAGAATQLTVIPWTVIDSPEAAEAFATTLEGKPISRHRMTSISGALTYSEQALERNPHRGARRVIDVSGDGPNNSGLPVLPVRDALVRKGIVINGLPILLKTGGANSAFDIPNLDAYYASCVIGGTGAFSLPVREKEGFAAAIRQKLLLEIAGQPPEPTPGLIRTRDEPEDVPVDCMIGEKLWRRYMDGSYR